MGVGWRWVGVGWGGLGWVGGGLGGGLGVGWGWVGGELGGLFKRWFELKYRVVSFHIVLHLKNHQFASHRIVSYRAVYYTHRPSNSIVSFLIVSYRFG